MKEENHEQKTDAFFIFRTFLVITLKNWVNAASFLQIKEWCLRSMLCEFHVIWSTRLDAMDAFVDAGQIWILGKQGAVVG